MANLLIIAYYNMCVRVYLHSLQQYQCLSLVLVGLQDQVSEFVDDDVQRALLLQGSAQVQLEGSEIAVLVDLQHRVTPLSY